MNISLVGIHALVCGSTQGIGKASAIELAKLGAKVTLLARNKEALVQTCKELDTSANQVHDFIVADFSNINGLKTSLEDYINKGNSISILVNNTGGPPAGPIAGAKMDEFLVAFNNHLLCNHLLVQLCIDGMKKNGYGRIINIISTSVKQPLKGLGVSNTIRAAVANWSKTLSLELAPYGITVNNVLPGATRTQRLETIISNKAQKNSESVTAVEQEMLSEIPMSRFAEASEIAAAVAFLASPAASYINGINLPVDGGRTGCL
ncbi:MAG: SDR family oxidoreductase [Bacteroidetes bacterium]|nr:SDR family oxidoreductase [Bacteroidota bacterium]